jgi:hypothetical protein
MSGKKLLAAILFPILSISCTDTKKTADVSDIQLTLNTRRFDLDLFALDTNNLSKGLVELAGKYPNFLNYYLDTVMAYGIRGNYSDTVKGIREGLRVFLTYKDFVALEDSVKAHYPDTKDVDAELVGGFKVVKKYVPKMAVPKIVYLNMGLSNWPSFPIDTATMCIGLDMFLGDTYPYYRSVGVPDFMGPHLAKNYISVSVFTSLYKYYYPFAQDERTLLDLMLQRGREQYFLHKVLPTKDENVLFGFSPIQMEWCRKFEANIYNFFVKNELLYNKEAVARFGYVNDGPFAQGMEPTTDTVKVSPGNVGSWIGYRIVNAYMERYPATTLTQLLDMRPEPSRFLDSAKYRPRSN